MFSSRRGPETFQAEVLGVVEKFFGSAGDLIIARLYGGPVDKTGVVAGMSGSPVLSTTNSWVRLVIGSVLSRRMPLPE